MFTFWQLVRQNGTMTYSFQRSMTIYPEGLVEIYKPRDHDAAGD
jgi:hypothetical protein